MGVPSCQSKDSSAPGSSSALLTLGMGDRNSPGLFCSLVWLWVPKSRAPVCVHGCAWTLAVITQRQLPTLPPPK